MTIGQYQTTKHSQIKSDRNMMIVMQTKRQSDERQKGEGKGPISF